MIVSILKYIKLLDVKNLLCVKWINTKHAEYIYVFSWFCNLNHFQPPPQKKTRLENKWTFKYFRNNIECKRLPCIWLYLTVLKVLFRILKKCYPDHYQNKIMCILQLTFENTSPWIYGKFKKSWLYFFIKTMILLSYLLSNKKYLRLCW